MPSLRRRWPLCATSLAVISMCTLAAAMVVRAESVPDSTRVVRVSIPAPSMRGNRLEAPDSMPIAVYLPPSYATGARRYPVVYFLPGFGDRVRDFVNPRYGFSLPGSVDSCIATGSARELILVVVNGFNGLGGSFYANSPVTGRWEDWVASDAVGWVDAHYRTLAVPASRGLAGHSMGGTGALRVGMKHPDVFGAVYAMSPGVFAPRGLEHSVFYSDSVVRRMFREDSVLAATPSGQRAEKLIADVMSAQDWDVLLSYAYGAAFSPDTTRPYPHMGHPFSFRGGQHVIHRAMAARWEAGFGALPREARAHARTLRTIRALGIEYGTHDDLGWLPEGCRYFSSVLDSIGVAHKLTAFEGGHEDRLGERMVTGMLPFFSQALAPQ